MPLDLYRTETLDRLSSLAPVENPEANTFDGFVRGSAMYTMRGFATTARAIDMLGAVGPIAQDAFTGGTEAQDRYFREHDEVFGSAVDYWTPRPNEVGVAGQVVGGLASLVPKVILSPGLAVGSEQLSAGEELVAKGVPPAKALTVGAIQGAATGLGLWVPILGRNLWERILVGGAGYNVTQGVVTRGASQLILADTEAAKDFRAFDPEAMTLDALLGMAFGSLAHVSPEARAQGAAAWNRIRTWAEHLNPSEVDAIAALRQAEHLNVDSAPGKPIGPEDVIAHVERMKTAIDQLAKDQPVEVTDHPAPRTERASPEEMAALRERFQELEREAERLRLEEGLAHPDDIEAAIAVAARETPYELAVVPFEVTPEMARRERLQEIAFERDLAQAVEDFAQKAGDEIGGVSHLQGVVSKLQKVYLEHGPEAGRAKLDEMAENAPESSGFSKEVATKDFVDELDAELSRRAEEFNNQRVSEGIPASAETVPEPARIAQEPPAGTEGETPTQALVDQGAREAAPAGAAPEAIGETIRADPIAQAADRFILQHPDLELTVGQNADGTPIRQRAADILAQAREARARAEEDAQLVRAAAQCLSGD